nr:MAG: hypothetical protein EDM05_24360 [Leptolyngbya sp. IPPAS B-1204]
MKTSFTDCPCCGYSLVRCFRHHRTVSFCRHCWQEVPDLTMAASAPLSRRQSPEPVIQPA